MNTRTRICAAAFTSLALALASGTADAQRHYGGSHGYHGGHGGYYRGGWGPGPFWGGIGLGLGLGIGTYYLTRPDYVVVDSAPTVVYTPPPVTVQQAPQPVPRAAAQPDPIFYPRSGQSAAQTEADRQECNRWATTQPSAMADASVFHRATLACMDGKGYTSR